MVSRTFISLSFSKVIKADDKFLYEVLLYNVANLYGYLC